MSGSRYVAKLGSIDGRPVTQGEKVEAGVLAARLSPPEELLSPFVRRFGATTAGYREGNTVGGGGRR